MVSRHVHARSRRPASFAVEWTDDAMTYVSYSEGFKGGGWNSHFNAVLTPAQQAALQEFEQEEAQTIEVGAKFDLADNTMRLNVAVFTSDYTDMQVTYRGPAPDGVAPFLTNAGETSIDGAEAEFTWAPTDDLLHRGAAWVTSMRRSTASPTFRWRCCRRASSRATSCRSRRNGRRTWASRTRRMPASLEIKPRVDASYPADRRSSMRPTRAEIAQLDDVTTVNASVVISSGDDSPWSVTLGVNNATDEEYPIAGNSSLTTGSGYAEIAYSRPREWFATLQVRVLEQWSTHPGSHRGCRTRGAAARPAVAQGGHRHTDAGAAQRGVRARAVSAPACSSRAPSTCSSAPAWQRGCTPKGWCTKAWRSAFAAGAIASISRRSRARASRCTARPR